jgi:hypothetical protein
MYKSWQSNDGEKHYFRFVEPENMEYPFKLEFFSRIPDALNLQEDSRYTPIPVEDEISSLSAILMDDDYYRLVKEGNEEIVGVSVVGAEYLIPIKMKAWMDLTDRKQSGANISRDDINKHRSDVFRLFQVIRPDAAIDLGESVIQDMNEGMKRLNENPALDLKVYGLMKTTVNEVVETFSKIYRLGK